MLSRISDRFHTWAKGWLILSIIAAFVLLVNLPLADPTLISMSLDGQFAYTPEQAFSAVASYGDHGRVQMIWIHLGDFILITLYTSMFCLSLSWLFQRSFKLNSRMQRLRLYPKIVLASVSGASTANSRIDSKSGSGPWRILRRDGKHLDHNYDPRLSSSTHSRSLAVYNLYDVQIHHGHSDYFAIGAWTGQSTNEQVQGSGGNSG